MTKATAPNRERIEADQLAMLNRLLAELVPANRFYAPRIEAAGLSRGAASIDEFAAKMPFTIKPQIVADQEAHPPYGSNLTYPIDHYTRFHQTSGTSGDPMRWLDTPQSWQWMRDNWKLVLEAAGVEPHDRLFTAFSFGPFIGFWTAYEAAVQIGCMCLPGGGLNSAARLRLMLDNQVTVLCCTPTYAIRLTEAAAEHHIDLKKMAVRLIIVAGEPGGSVPQVRDDISRRWNGARVFDHHGMTEVGPVTFECPKRPGTLRVIESGYIAEVIDRETTHPVAPGEMGELVLTTLGRAGSPLLRYRTGDLVRLAYVNDAGDAPGENLALEGGIIGRIDDMVIVRGVNVYPSAIDRIVRSHPDVAEYRVEIDTSGTMTQMTLIIEPAPHRDADEGLIEAIEDELRNALALRVPVRLAAPASLPRFEMKAKRWVKV